MISFEHVSKSYHVKGVRKTILDNASYRFEDGKNIALMGQNGAGKSTMMRLIAGIELPSSGTVFRDEKVSWPMGFASGFNGMMTGVENVRFVSRIYGVTPRNFSTRCKSFRNLESLSRCQFRPTPVA